MTDIQKLTDAVFHLFSLGDKDGDGYYSMAKGETIDMDPSLYFVLDITNGWMGDGYSKAGFEKFFRHFEGLKGLAKFYPYYDFTYDENCHDVRVTLKPEIDQYFKGEIAPTDINVQAFLKDHGLTPQVFDDTMLLRHARHLPNAAGVIAVEDRHRILGPAETLRRMVEKILQTRESIVLFTEQSAGTLVYTERTALNDWQLARDLLAKWSTMPERFDEPIITGSVQDESVRRILKRVCNEVPRAVWDVSTFPALAASIKKNATFAEAILILQPSLYLKSMYGDRILIANVESERPTTMHLLQKEPEHRVATPPFDKILAATRVMDTFTRRTKVRISCSDDFESQYALGGDVAAAIKTLVDTDTEREGRWTTNISTLAGGSKQPYLILLMGGRRHISRVVGRLEGKFSTLVIGAHSVNTP